MFPFLDDLLNEHYGTPPVANHVENHVDNHVLCLQEILSKKYGLLLAYIHYGDQLRILSRDGVYHHFQEHIAEERSYIYELNKKITALGSDALVQPIAVPLVPLNDAKAIFTALMTLEESVVALWSDLFHKTTDDVPLNALAQNGAHIDQQHADDMKRYLRSE